jgi:hypothetical protein
MSVVLHSEAVRNEACMHSKAVRNEACAVLEATIYEALPCISPPLIRVITLRVYTSKYP